MSVPTGIREGLNPYDVVLRIVESADRLHALADSAESRGRIADAARAIAVEVQTLNMSLNPGLKGQDELDTAKDAAELEQAIAQLIRRAPASGSFVAERLEEAGRPAYAARFRQYTDKCKAQPQVLENKGAES